MKQQAKTVLDAISGVEVIQFGSQVDANGGHRKRGYGRDFCIQSCGLLVTTEFVDPNSPELMFSQMADNYPWYADYGSFDSNEVDFDTKQLLDTSHGGEDEPPLDPFVSLSRTLLDVETGEPFTEELHIYPYAIVAEVLTKNGETTTTRVNRFD
ncbi:hypothetical protein ACPV5S_15830 [Vibrio astriarenae]